MQRVDGDEIDVVVSIEIRGGEIVRAEIRGARQQASALGNTVAEELLSHGAATILRELYAEK